MPLLLHHLGRDAYGLYAALAAVAGYFGLLTFGATLTVPRYVADHAARGAREALSDFVSTYLAAHMVVGAAGLLLGLAATPLLAAHLVVPAALARLVAPAWRFVLAGWALGLAAGMFQSLLVGLGDVHLAKLADAARTVLNLAVAATVLWTGGGLERVLAGFGGAAAVSSAGLFILIRRRRPDIDIALRRARLATLRLTLGPASYYFLMQVAALVVMGTDNIVIGAFVGVGAVAAYAIAFQLWTMTLAVLWTGVDALQPFFTQWDATGDAQRLRSAYLRATRLSFAGAALSAVGMAWLGRAAIAVWVGRSLGVDQRLLVVFAAMLLTATPIHVAALALAALGRHKAPALGGAVEAALNLGLSLALVRPLGVLGVAIGTLASGAVTNAWIAPLAANRALGIRTREYLGRALLPACVPALVLAGVAVAVTLARAT